MAIRRPKSHRRPATNLRRVIEAVKATGGLGTYDHEYLRRWINDDRAEEVWAAVESAMKERHGGDYVEGFGRVLVREILIVRWAARDPDYQVDYLARAQQTGDLARFLGRRPPPVHMPKLDELVGALRSAELRMREHAKEQKSRGRKRPVRRSSARPRVEFMRGVSESLLEFCGRHLDRVAVVLTDIAFPDQETTVDQVRSARRPTTRASRRRPAN